MALSNEDRKKLEAVNMPTCERCLTGYGTHDCELLAEHLAGLCDVDCKYCLEEEIVQSLVD